jgi:tetratricopeptide (TPR) repeat protein
MTFRIVRQGELLLLLIFFMGGACTTLEQPKSPAFEDLFRGAGATINLNEPSLALGGSEIVSSQLFAGLKDRRSEIYQAFTEKQWDLAISRCRSFLNLYPGNTNAQLLLASAYAASEDYSRAGFFAELVLRKDPQNPTALNLLGVVTWKQALILEDYREAVAYFNLASQYGKGQIGPSLNLAYMQLRLGNLESAWTEFANAAKTCNGCIAAKIGSALAAQRLNKFDAALADINDILAIDSQHPLALYLKSVHYLVAQGDRAEAREWAMKVVESEQADYEIQEKARELVNDFN